MSNISSLSLNLLVEEVYLKGKINSLNEDILNKKIKMEINPVLKKIVSELKGNFNFVMTYGVGISGFIGPIKTFLENKNLKVTDYDVTLLIITAIYILISKPKEEIDEVVEKLKEKKLESEISPVLSFISKSTSFFKKLGAKFGYTINGLLDILSFTFLSLPILTLIKDLAADKGFTLNSIQELLTSVFLAVVTHGLKILINKDKIKENILKKESIISENKFNFLTDMNLIGLRFYNPEEFREGKIIYTIWDQDSSVNSIDIEWESTDDLDEDGQPMTEYSTMQISSLVEGLESGLWVLMPTHDMPNVYDVISSLNENKKSGEIVFPKSLKKGDRVIVSFITKGGRKVKSKIAEILKKHEEIENLYLFRFEDWHDGIKFKSHLESCKYKNCWWIGSRNFNEFINLRVEKFSDFPNVYDILADLNESEDDWYESIVKGFSDEEIEGLHDRVDLIEKVINSVKEYNGWRIFQDEMSGVFYWKNANFADILVAATPEWGEEFEIPIDIFNNDDGILYSTTVKTPEFVYVNELNIWYRNNYFKIVYDVINDFISKNN